MVQEGTQMLHKLLINLALSEALHRVTQHEIILGSLASRLFLAVCSASVESAPRLVTRFFGSKVERKTWRRLLKTSLEGLGTLPEIWLLVIGDGNAMFTYKFRNQTRKDKNLVWG